MATSDEVNMGVVVEKKRRRKNDKKIDDKRSLQVTFSKRRKGLFNKAKVLRERYKAEVGIIVFSPAGRPFGDEPETRPVLERYLRDHDADDAPAVGVINWWDTVDVAKVESEEELHAMYNALEELRRRVLARADLLAAAEHACEPLQTLGFSAATPIDCTGEEDHVQLCVPHYRSTTTSAIDYGRPLALPATMEVEASGGGHLSPSPGYFAMAGEDPLQGRLLAAVPTDCTGELSQVDQEDVQLYASHEISTYQSTYTPAIESEGPAVLPVTVIDVDAQASRGDCPAELPEFPINEELEAWEPFWPEEAFRGELLAAPSVLAEAAAGEYAMLPPVDLESLWEVPLSYWIPNSV